MTRVLVAGTYPPVPGEAAAATLAEVRRLLGDGADVEVVSSRPTAAHHVGSLRGASSAWTLRRLRRRGFDRLVLCLEPGLPFTPDAPRWRTAFGLAALQAALGAFSEVEFVIEEGLEPAWAVRRLAASGVVRRRPRPGEDAVPAGTPHGPTDWLPGERRAHVKARAADRLYRVELLASRGARAVLGRRAAALGPPLRRLVHPLRPKEGTAGDNRD